MFEIAEVMLWSVWICGMRSRVHADRDWVCSPGSLQGPARGSAPKNTW